MSDEQEQELKTFEVTLSVTVVVTVDAVDSDAAYDVALNTWRSEGEEDSIDHMDTEEIG